MAIMTFMCSICKYRTNPWIIAAHNIYQNYLNAHWRNYYFEYSLDEEDKTLVSDSYHIIAKSFYYCF